MKLSERLDKALAKRNLDYPPPPKQALPPRPSKQTPPQPAKEITTNYPTVQEGLRNLQQHNTDEDGVGSFTAKNLGIDKIQLPMTVGEYVVEDIQRTKTGIIQVQFRKSQ